MSRTKSSLYISFLVQRAMDTEDGCHGVGLMPPAGPGLRKLADRSNKAAYFLFHSSTSWRNNVYTAMISDSIVPQHISRVGDYGLISYRPSVRPQCTQLPLIVMLSVPRAIDSGVTWRVTAAQQRLMRPRSRRGPLRGIAPSPALPRIRAWLGIEH